MIRLILAAMILGTAACTPSIQTTSGADYVRSAPDGVTRAIDADIAAIATIEPDLHFPARIGLARIVNGALALPPADELALFEGLAERNAQYGAFVPVSPLIMAMVTPSQTAIGSPEGPNRFFRGTVQTTGQIVHDIRLTSARQHLDYVIIYEVGAHSRTGDTPFALADITLIGGMLLPTRNIQVAGVGAAMFVDVRNGYPYATTQVAEDISGLARTFATDRRRETLRAQATFAVTKALIPEIETMLTELARRAK